MITGTTISQTLPIAISPILTRLYSPSDFGVLSLYLALTSVMGVIITGRYEMTIVLSENNKDAFSLAIVGILISMIISSIFFVIICFFSHQLSNCLGNDNIQEWLYVLPLSLLLTGFYQVLIYWYNRNKYYTQLSLSRVIQNGSAVVIQSSLGYGKLITQGGLIIGTILGQFISVAMLIKLNLKTFVELFPSVTYSRLIENAKEYRNFPLISIWGALLDTASVHTPLFIISMFFGTSIAGSFSFSFKILTIPIVLISTSIAQVLFQKINQIHKEKPEEMLSYVSRIFILLSILCIPFMCIFLTFGKELFTFAFGKNWSMAGEFASILSLSAGIRFIVSPLSALLLLKHNVKKAVVWQICYFALSTTLFLYTDRPIEIFLKIFVSYEIMMYGIYLIIIFFAARFKRDPTKTAKISSLVLES
ncbi:MAG: oligosaccharide flippase family protein [Bacteroidota bacterium]|nr:oligosaccharide flippase family protein [Bacteroidota bacterium]